jgi:hypothetical protein
VKAPILAAVALGLVATAASATAQSGRSAGGDQLDPAITFAHGNYLLGWADRRDEPAEALAPAGPPPPPPPPPTPPHASIYGTRVKPSGAVLDGKGLPVSTDANIVSRPAIATGGPFSLLAWTDYLNNGQAAAVYASRIGAGGAVLGPRITVATSQSAMLTYKTSTGVAFDGTNFLVVWQDYDYGRGVAVYAARVSPEGSVLDTTPILIGDGGSQPAVAFDGANYMVVWWDYDFPTGRDIHATRISPSGAVLGTTTVEHSLDSVPEPAIAFNGQTYLVAWIGDPAPAGMNHVRGSRVDGSGQVLDPSGIEIAAVPGELYDLAAASDRRNYIVAWADSRSGCCEIYVARVSAAAGVLDPNGVSITSRSAADRGSPAIAYGGSNYLVAWSQQSFLDKDIYGARVSPGGVVRDRDGILLSTNDPPPPPVRCVVPKVVGLRLSRARSKIRRAHCSVGAVRRKRAGRARVGVVLAQRPRARVIKHQGYPVTLVVGKR